MSDDLLACLRELAGPHVSVAASGVGDEDGLLDPEPLAVLNAIPKRRAEFAAGRRAARLALQRAGLPGVAIPQGKNRAPVWPGNVVGSLTHDNELAVAVVALKTKVSRLGLDLAEATDFPKHLRDEILRTPRERMQNGLEARLSFSAKETVFKAFYPEVGRYFGFGAVEVSPRIADGTFTATLLEDLGTASAGFSFKGCVCIAGSRLATLLSLPA